MYDRFKSRVWSKIYKCFVDVLGVEQIYRSKYFPVWQKGDLFFTYVPCSLNQKQTQSNKGGMSDLYLDSGTYVKSFYSVIFYHRVLV